MAVLFIIIAGIATYCETRKKQMADTTINSQVLMDSLERSTQIPDDPHMPSFSSSAKPPEETKDGPTKVWEGPSWTSQNIPQLAVGGTILAGVVVWAAFAGAKGIIRSLDPNADAFLRDKERRREGAKRVDKR